jgi:hypothetical protein
MAASAMAADGVGGRSRPTLRHCASGCVNTALRFGGLRFGNHRKYGTHDPAKRGRSTADIVESYLAWVRKNGGSSQEEIFDSALRSRSAQDAFDSLFNEITVLRFGRTAKFDWLCRLGNLGLYPIAPGRCYLRDSSGPLAGARRLFESRGRGRSIEELEDEAKGLTEMLGVPVEVIEDALCNWQKKASADRGWLTTACR